MKVVSGLAAGVWVFFFVFIFFEGGGGFNFMGSFPAFYGGLIALVKSS